LSLEIIVRGKLREESRKKNYFSKFLASQFLKQLKPFFFESRFWGTSIPIPIPHKFSFFQNKIFQVDETDFSQFENWILSSTLFLRNLKFES